MGNLESTDVTNDRRMSNFYVENVNRSDLLGKSVVSFPMKTLVNLKGSLSPPSKPKHNKRKQNNIPDEFIPIEEYSTSSESVSNSDSSCVCTVDDLLATIVSQLSKPTDIDSQDIPCHNMRNSCITDRTLNLAEDRTMVRSKSTNDIYTPLARTGTSYNIFQDNSDYLITQSDFAKHIQLNESDVTYKVPSNVPRRDHPEANDGPPLPSKQNTKISSSDDMNTGVAAKDISLFFVSSTDSNEEDDDVPGYITPVKISDGTEIPYATPSNVPRIDFFGGDDGPQLPPKESTLRLQLVESEQSGNSKDDQLFTLARSGSTFKKFQASTDNYISDNNFARHIIVHNSDTIYKVPSNVQKADHPEANCGPELPPKKTYLTHIEPICRTKSESDLIYMNLPIKGTNTHDTSAYRPPEDIRSQRRMSRKVDGSQRKKIYKVTVERTSYAI